MQRECERLIAQEFRACVQNTIGRLESADTHRPFHNALLSTEALFWSRFERSFSTSFGQRVVEQISKAAALNGGAQTAETQKETILTLSAAQLNEIEAHIVRLRNSRSDTRRVNWVDDLRELAAVAPAGIDQEVRVISDLWWKRDGIDNFMSIKTVKPNIDQAAEAKRDLLKIKLAYPTANVYFGLYYNPYGDRREDYAWSPPKKIFNFNTDPCVLIGKEYWDTLGGVGFYEELLAIAVEVGVDTRHQIEQLR